MYLDTQTNHRYDVSRSSWIADYADPINFLGVMQTESANNRTGWSHADFDRLIGLASRENDAEQRMSLLQRAEAILVHELPILPIYDYVTRNVVAPRLGGFHANALDEHWPKFLYWMDDDELEGKRAALAAGEPRVRAHGPAEGLYSPAARRRRASSRP